MFCEDYSWLKNVKFPTLHCLLEALPGKYLTLGTVWPFPFLGFPLGIRDSISSASVIHPPFRLLFGNLLIYLPSNHLHVTNSVPSPSPPAFICLPGVFHWHTPTECQKVEFPWTILAAFIYIFFLKWLPVPSKNKLIFHDRIFQSCDFLTDLNQFG